MKRKALKRMVAVVSIAALLVAGMPAQQIKAAKKIKLNKSKVTIKVGKSIKLKLKNAKKKVVWKSSNKKVAIVSSKGKVTGKKAGNVKIIAKSAGKKYVCKVTVKKTDSTAPVATDDNITGTSTPAVSQTPGASQQPSGTASATPSHTPSQTKKPLVEGTISPTETQTPTVSNAPNQEETQVPVVSETPVQSQSPAVSETPAQSQGPAVTQTPEPDYEEPTLEISEIALGMSLSDVRSIMGEEDRSEATPQGYTGYIFNPDMSYEDYILVYVDNEKVVGWATMSINYNYGDLVSIGGDASKLSGFSNMTSYDYEAGYLYTGSSEYVMAFSDHQNDSTIYAVQVFSKTDGNGNSVELDNLIKPENLTYNSEITGNMAIQLADWVNAFRCYLDLDTVDYCDVHSATGADAAQKHSEDMAANNNISSTSSDGTTYKERFEANYREIAGMYEGDTLGKGENNGGRNPDAFGFVTWWIDDSDAPTSRKNICRSVATYDGEEYPLTDYYLCTGFAYNSSASNRTFATLDFFY